MWQQNVPWLDDVLVCLWLVCRGGLVCVSLQSVFLCGLHVIFLLESAYISLPIACDFLTSQGLLISHF